MRTVATFFRHGLFISTIQRPVLFVGLLFEAKVTMAYFES